MARITVEDCLENVDNRFELVLVASKRARQLSHGAETTLAWENDKPTVVALREIADNLVNAAILEESNEPEMADDDLVALEAALAEKISETPSPTPEVGQ